jgi:eukaryotic-like serine/threonine-protein kinase
MSLNLSVRSRRLMLVPVFAMLSTQVCSAGLPSKAQEPSFHAGRQYMIVRPAGSLTNWPQQGFDSGHTGYNPYEAILNSGNVGSLTRLWTFPTGSSNVAGNVVEANGTIYAASTNGTLFAIDAAAGTKRWTFASGTGYVSSGSAPAVDNGLVFTVCSLPNGIQAICALKAKNGELKWSYAVPGATTYAESAPVFANGNVYFGGCGTSCAYVALSEEKGKVVWSVPEPSGCAMNNGQPPAVVDGLFYATTSGCSSAEVIALNAQTGAPVWNLPLNSGALAGMTVAKGVVAVVTAFSGGQDVYALSATGGGVLWVTGGHSSHITAPSYPAIAKGILYAPNLGDLFAFKLKVHGRFKIVFDAGGLVPSAAVANGVVYSLSFGYPWAADAYSGDNLWIDYAAGTNVGVPIVVNGAVYGACDGTNICAWALPGSLRRR